MCVPYDKLEVNLSKKRREGRDFPRAGRAAPRDFPKAKPKGNPEEQPCQPEENFILLNSQLATDSGLFRSLFCP